MPFDIVRVGTDEVRCTCETGGEANRLAVSLNGAETESGSNTRFRVIQRKADTPEIPAWWQREYDRICASEYKCTPWLYDPWFSGRALDDNLSADYVIRLYAGKHGHFAHVAKGNPEMIAFTPDDAFGGRDAQRRMRVGRYLQQYYGDVLSNERIQELCASWDVEFGVGLEIKFASTREEIANVYMNGPQSCMSHSLDEYRTEDTHPSEAYAAGDLAIAYLENGSRITARAICWPEKKLYGRVYGDSHRLHELMQALEYEHENYEHGCTGFCGARLLKISHRGGYVMPWLDHVGRVSDNGKFFVIDDDGEYDAQDTGGLLNGDHTQCFMCNEYYNSDEEGSNVDGHNYCDNCLADHTFYCEGCNEQRAGEARYSSGLDHDYCDDCYRERHSHCHECGEEHANHGMTVDVDDNLWCEDCAADATRNEFGEIDETYEPPEDTSDVYEPSPTIYNDRQESLPL